MRYTAAAVIGFLAGIAGIAGTLATLARASRSPEVQRKVRERIGVPKLLEEVQRARRAETLARIDAREAIESLASRVVGDPTPTPPSTVPYTVQAAVPEHLRKRVEDVRARLPRG